MQTIIKGKGNMGIHNFALLAGLVGVGVGLSWANAPSSSEERAKGLREGRGMGYAVSAENNGYPGPRHVLEAADKLDLSETQRQQTAVLIAEMKAEAIPAGERLLADESALGQLFATKSAMLPTISVASDKASRSESALRVIHLKYHLKMVRILTPEQIRTYYALGGASGISADKPMPPGHAH